MKIERKTEIRKKVRSQIAGVMQADLDGDEFLMKEVWEDMADDAEMDVAKDEMRRILAFLRQPVNPLTVDG
jgi:hypothetical protein